MNTHPAWESNKTSMLIITFMMLVILAFFGYKTVELNRKQVEFDKKETYLLQKIDEQNARTEEIENYRKYMETKQYVEDMAKEKLGLVYPDEIIFEAENWHCYLRSLSRKWKAILILPILGMERKKQQVR